MSEINFTQEQTTNNQGKKVVILKINGMLDESTADNFAPQIYDLINKEENEVSFILDLENLLYMNSKSIGYVSDFYNKLNEKNAKLVISKPKVNVLETLQVVGLDQIIKFTQTNKEALMNT